ncbi:nucleotide disphospho-sugar-binding domain-containing protein [Tropicimonas aquimaris]|uniref:Nucleotide disphospho-sugar-binding domain-containing protein n=1 Tax=Tropicimonas aquimaris TaxID=914152 RepID=A0ABW3IWX5_9RHOB
MARILVASTGMLSSVFVAAEFGRRLVRDGHEAVLVTTENHGDRVREFGLAFRAMPKVPITPLACPLEGLGKNPFVRTPARRRQRLEETAAMLGAAEFGAMLDEITPDLAVIDFELHGPIIAALGRGQRTALLHCFFSTMVGPRNPPLGSFTVPGSEPEGAPEPVMNEWSNLLRWKRRQEIVGALRHWGGDIPSALGHLARKHRVARDMFLRRRWQYPWGYRLPCLMTSPAELDFPGEGDDDVRYIGPMIAGTRPEGASQADVPGILGSDAAANGKPVVLASFGTVNSPPPAFLEALWAAFEARPDRVLVHVVPPNADAPRRPPPDNVTVVNWLDQPAALERASLMINHGGVGSVREAAHRGVPQIVVAADMMDRPGGAARVLSHGLGARLTGREAAEQISGTIDAVLADEGIAAACARMSEASQSYAAGRVAERELRRLLDEERK